VPRLAPTSEFQSKDKSKVRILSLGMGSVESLGARWRNPYRVVHKVRCSSIHRQLGIAPHPQPPLVRDGSPIARRNSQNPGADIYTASPIAGAGAWRGGVLCVVGVSSATGMARDWACVLGGSNLKFVRYRDHKLVMCTASLVADFPTPSNRCRTTGKFCANGVARHHSASSCSPVLEIEPFAELWLILRIAQPPARLAGNLGSVGKVWAIGVDAKSPTSTASLELRERGGERRWVEVEEYIGVRAENSPKENKTGMGGRLGS
jgi:hypothetical protein